MKRKIEIISLLFILALFIIRSTLSLFRNSLAIDSSSTLATWNVTLEQNGVDRNLTVVPEISNATYTLNVKSLSEVDVKYDVIISGLPTGIEVSIDGTNFQQETSGVVSFIDAGTILYNASNKTDSKTLTFRGTSSATAVNNQTVTVNVIAKQAISS